MRVIQQLQAWRRIAQQPAAAQRTRAATGSDSHHHQHHHHQQQHSRSGMLTAATANGRAEPGAGLLLDPVCTSPAFQAAECALIDKLAGGAARCREDYKALERLNEEVMRCQSLAEALDNRDCNRYTDVLPYDHSRVRLTAVPPGGRDYLNASLLAGPPEGEGASAGAVRWSYIAAQGPLDHTCEHFWQAVYEQRCSAVVMLTNCEERNMRKCARYFPSQPATKKSFGRFSVKTAEVQQVGQDLRRRSLLVAPSGGGGERHAVHHYHFEAWPDHGVPSSALPLLRICEELLQSGAHRRPILVHCSAGIGRSGVFCVLDIVTRRLRQLHPGDARGGAEAVDLRSLVAHMRQQRMGMVQTCEQYVFCHAALLGFLRSLDAARQGAGGQEGTPGNQP